MYQSQDQNGTTPYGPPTARVPLHNIRHGRGGRLVTLAAAAALLSLTLAAAALTMLLLNGGSTATQIRQMQQELTAEQSALSQAQASGNGQYRGLSGKITSIDTALDYLGQFDQTCTQDFTGPNGPAEYWFLCSSHLPG
jgi:hypothetical protein